MENMHKKNKGHSIKKASEGFNSTISTNRKAKHEYYIKETFESGIELKGTEVKAIRIFGINIDASYIKIHKNECYMVNSNIKEIGTNKFDSYQSRRDRKLLLHKKEIINLFNKSKMPSYTIVPLSVYYKGRRNFIKLKIGLVEGKKNYDKRKSIKEKEWKREKDRIAKDLHKRI